MEDLNLRTAFHTALDEVALPAPWLADEMHRHIRTAESVVPKGGRARRHRFDRPSWLLPAVAAALTLALIASLVFIAHTLQVPRTVPSKGHSVPTRAPIALSRPLPMDCAPGCNLARVVYATPQVAWAIVASQSFNQPPQTYMAPSTLYRTDDGGLHWNAQLSWNNPQQPISSVLLPNNIQMDSTEADQIKVSPDGREALVITGWSADGSAGLFHTSDAGAHWQSFGFPVAAQPVVTCLQETYVSSGCGGPTTVAPRYFFLNTREGWVVSQRAGSAIDDIFHTTDGGADWQLAASMATTSTLDLVNGRLLFASSTLGWFVPDYTGTPAIAHTIYRTIDGGRSWSSVSLAQVPPAARSENGTPNRDDAVIYSMKFFNDHDGVIEVARVFGGGPPGQPGSESYAYTTSDGGASWSTPRLTPNWVIDFVDPTHWIVPNGGLLSRTNDGGKTWTSQTPSYHGTPAGLAPLIRPMEFVDPAHGWAGVGCSGILIVATSDGGSNWTLASLPYAQPSNIGGMCV